MLDACHWQLRCTWLCLRPLSHTRHYSLSSRKEISLALLYNQGRVFIEKPGRNTAVKNAYRVVTRMSESQVVIPCRSKRSLGSLRAVLTEWYLSCFQVVG